MAAVADSSSADGGGHIVWRELGQSKERQSQRERQNVKVRWVKKLGREGQQASEIDRGSHGGSHGVCVYVCVCAYVYVCVCVCVHP